LNNNQLSDSIPTELGNLTLLKQLSLNSNQLSGSIPTELGNLINLEELYLGNNQLTGGIPTGLSNLDSLNNLYLQSNELDGTVPDFNGINNLNIKNNNFSCDDLSVNFSSNNQSQNFTYSPQFFDEAKPYVIDANTITLQQTNDPSTLNNPSYLWKKNDTILVGANSAVLTINNASVEDVGVYTLHITYDCVPGIEFISEPHNVIYEGVDMTGQPVIEGQLIVEFNSPEETAFYEESVLEVFEGEVLDACDCNRELFLWDFPTTDDFTAALSELEIDMRIQTVKRKLDVDGGFNNNIKADSSSDKDAANKILSYMHQGSYPDSVTIYLLDTGLDNTGISNTSCLMAIAPVDNCYVVNPASGYNYITPSITVDNNYMDEQRHGTFGYWCIADELTDELSQPNNIDVVPLKVFDKNGRGNLFQRTRNLYLCRCR